MRERVNVHPAGYPALMRIKACDLSFGARSFAHGVLADRRIHPTAEAASAQRLADAAVIKTRNRQESDCFCFEILRARRMWLIASADVANGRKQLRHGAG